MFQRVSVYLLLVRVHGSHGGFNRDTQSREGDGAEWAVRGVKDTLHDFGSGLRGNRRTAMNKIFNCHLHAPFSGSGHQLKT